MSNLLLPFSKDITNAWNGWSFLDEQVNLVHIDPPYNVRKKSRRSGADYDKLATNYMAAITMLCRHLMKSGSHGNFFCSDVQFPKWIQVMQVGLDENQGVQQVDIVAKQISLVYVRDKTNYLQNSSLASTYHLSLTQHAMQFWRIGGIHEVHGTCLQNRAEPLYFCLFPSNTNSLTGIS